MPDRAGTGVAGADGATSGDATASADGTSGTDGTVGPDGPTAVARALAGQVKPTFMLPAVGMSAFGALLAPTVDPATLALHAAGVGLALYVAHLVDEYVDAHVRGEDPPTLSRRTLALATVLTSASLGAVAVALADTAGALAGLSLLPLWLLALLHAPALDRNVVGVTLDYPVGIALVLLGGYHAQAGRVHPAVLALAAVFLVLLAGVKVAVDRLDSAFDRRIDKRTVPVVLGDRRAARVAALVLATAGALVVAFAAAGVLPPATVAAAPFPLATAACCLRLGPRRAVSAAIVLTYPFTAVLFLATCPATGCGVVDALPLRAVVSAAAPLHAVLSHDAGLVHVAPRAFGLVERVFAVGYR